MILKNDCNRDCTCIKCDANKSVCKKDQYNLQAEVFKAMANEEISVDLINISPNGVVYTVTRIMTDRACIKVLKEIGYDPVVKEHCAKVSVVGAGIAGVPGVTSKIVTALIGKRNSNFTIR